MFYFTRRWGGFIYVPPGGEDDCERVARRWRPTRRWGLWKSCQEVTSHQEVRKWFWCGRQTDHVYASCTEKCAAIMSRIKYSILCCLEVTVKSTWSGRRSRRSPHGVDGEVHMEWTKRIESARYSPGGEEERFDVVDKQTTWYSEPAQKNVPPLWAESNIYVAWR